MQKAFSQDQFEHYYTKSLKEFENCFEFEISFDWMCFYTLTLAQDVRLCPSSATWSSLSTSFNSLSKFYAEVGLAV
ncbi:MAG: hypothetical protein EZS28_002680 [Streblomastix strix]|uniref:Uncharacterized protein n=1 Tax=Streblomastix strix TaxID=222440 RepID=A0A5J4X4W9_9EUKA|nr:MAG: hypothetical protein EZS28_002680 [Streblomastix strix]